MVSSFPCVWNKFSTEILHCQNLPKSSIKVLTHVYKVAIRFFLFLLCIWTFEVPGWQQDEKSNISLKWWLYEPWIYTDIFQLQTHGLVLGYLWSWAHFWHSLQRSHWKSFRGLVDTTVIFDNWFSADLVSSEIFAHADHFKEGCEYLHLFGFIAVFAPVS